MRIGILNSGGDCPGLNAVIHGVVGAAHQLGWEVIGFRDGFEGLLPPGDFRILTPTDTIGILKLGGTILGCTNKGHFAAKVGAGDVTEVPKEIIDRAKTTLDRLDISALVVVGGDGSLTTALQLYRAGWPVVGVPKTIDNDLCATATRRAVTPRSSSSPRARKCRTKASSPWMETAAAKSGSAASANASPNAFKNSPARKHEPPPSATSSAADHPPLSTASSA